MTMGKSMGTDEHETVSDARDATGGRTASHKARAAINTSEERIVSCVDGLLPGSELTNWTIPFQ